MSVSTTEKINIDVTLSTPSSTVTQNYYPNNVAVSLPGVQGEAGIAGQDGQDGARGPAGPDGNFTPSGPDKAIQFKNPKKNHAGGGAMSPAAAQRFCVFFVVFNFFWCLLFCFFWGGTFWYGFCFFIVAPTLCL